MPQAIPNAESLTHNARISTNESAFVEIPLFRWTFLLFAGKEVLEAA